jgi:hypothetical protein
MLIRDTAAESTTDAHLPTATQRFRLAAALMGAGSNGTDSPDRDHGLR